jgi:hypothetical protein
MPARSHLRSDTVGDLDGRIPPLTARTERECDNAVRPSRAVQAAADGAGHGGGLILYVDDGWLSALEYWWVTEERHGAFPPALAIGAPVAAK